MIVYRIAKATYIRELTGEGARIHGGRWNQRGTNMIYTSEHESLAVLEILVHTTLHTIPENLQILELKMDSDVSVQTITPSTLPSNWRNYPAPRRLADIGTAWVQNQTSLLLKVPSVIVPTEFNILINPDHDSFDSIEIREIRDFQLDERLT